MFLVNPIQHWQTIIFLVVIQSVMIFALTWILRFYVIKKYKNCTGSYKVFDCSNYNLRFDFDASQCPKNSLILVNFNSDRTLKKETFYTSLGNIIYFEYDNGQKIKTKGFGVSRLVVIISCVPGIIIMILFNLFNMTRFFLNLDSAFILTLLENAKLFLGIPLWSGAILILLSPFFKDEVSNIT